MVFDRMKAWYKEVRRRRRSFDLLPSQPRTPKRRPRNLNGQTGTALDPNARFPGN